MIVKGESGVKVRNFLFSCEDIEIREYLQNVSAFLLLMHSFFVFLP